MKITHNQCSVKRIYGKDSHTEMVSDEKQQVWEINGAVEYKRREEMFCHSFIVVIVWIGCRLKSGKCRQKASKYVVLNEFLKWIFRLFEQNLVLNLIL